MAGCLRSGFGTISQRREANGPRKAGHHKSSKVRATCSQIITPAAAPPLR